MNYNKVYKQLIDHAKSRNLTKKDCYIEQHHIIPRSEGGIDDKSNIVNLTAREHYIVHLLLAKIYNDAAMHHAVVMMRNSSNKKQRKYRFNSHLYAKLRVARNNMMKGVPSKNKGVSGVFHWFNNGNEEVYVKECPDGFKKGRLPMSQSQRQKIRHANLGKHASAEAKDKMSKSHKGRIPWNSGMKGKMPKDFIDKMSMLFSGSNNSMYGKCGKLSPNIGKHWFNNGIVNVFDYTCPNGFQKGKIHRK